MFPNLKIESSGAGAKEMLAEKERQTFEKGFMAGYDRGRFDSTAGKVGYAGLEEEMNDAWEEYKRREQRAEPE
jgi:flagellar biosynthesis/type III secretory pathway protein FliH